MLGLYIPLSNSFLLDWYCHEIFDQCISDSKTIFIENSWQHDVLSTTFYWQVICLWNQYIIIGSTRKYISKMSYQGISIFVSICNVDIEYCFISINNVVRTRLFINQYMLVTSLRALEFEVLACQRYVKILSSHPSHHAQRSCALDTFFSFN